MTPTLVRRLAAFALWGLLWPSLSRAGPGEYLIDVWDADRGLPSSFVTSLAQTREGYLWAGTHGGLVRFDGARFVTFDPANTPEIQHPRIEQLAVDGDGTLWISSYDGSLASLREGRFAREWSGTPTGRSTGFLASTRGGRPLFVFDDGKVIRRRSATPGDWEALGVPPTRLDPIFADAQDALWIRSSDHRLWRLVGDRFEEAATTGLRGDRFRHLASDSTGRLWISTNQELAVFEEGRFQSRAPGDGAGEIAFFFPARDGGYWAVVNGQPRRWLDGRWAWNAGAVQDFTGYPRLSLVGLEASQGGAWFGHAGRGLLHVRRDGSMRKITSADGLPGDAVKACLEDREGNVWAAVDRGGLVRIREAAFQVLSTAQGLGAKAAGTVAEDDKGSIWIGTHGGGLHRLRDGVLTSYPLPSVTAGGFVFSLYPDGRGGLWLSGDREDLLLFDGAAIRRPPWGVHAIKAILVDSHQRVWFGTKGGLARLLHGTLDGGIQYFGADQGFEPQDVRAFAEDKDGAVWIGAGDGSVYRFADDTFTRFHPNDVRPGQGVWSLQADPAGGVWIGTSGGGLLRLQNGVFTRYTAKDGLPSDVICQILDDGEGRLWVGSQSGLFRADKSSLEAFARGETSRIAVRGYGRSDGWPTSECSGLYQPSAWRARDGRLWFATPKGIVSVQPRQMTDPLPPPTVLIEEVRLDGALQETATDAALPVPPGERRLELTYTGISLSAPERVRFRYRLEGLESRWVDAGERRRVQYSYLRPGHYRFTVTASYGDENWGPENALALVVEPRLTETRWFFGFVALLSAGVVAAIVRSVSAHRFRRELERLEWQQAVERDRARISKDIHDDLGAGLSQISLLSDLVQREGARHAQAHLDQISGTARELIRTMDEIVWAVNPRHDTLKSLVTYVCQFAQGYLALAEIQCRLDIPPVVPARPLTSEVRHNLFLAVKEALHNVVRHAAAREVWLRFRLDETGFALIIEDDGRGFSIAEPIGRETSAASGDGLASLRERMAAVGGRATVHSEPGRGTRVELAVNQISR